MATASIVLRPTVSNDEVRAHLTWHDSGRLRSRSLGVVCHTTRRANLLEAWERARKNGLVRDDSLPSDSWAASLNVRASMRGNRGRDTRPELELRALLHARGLRYRVSARPEADLRRTADVVFSRARVAVFVDGCFWHGCPQHHRPATQNSEFWNSKIAGNIKRDRETDQFLAERGWKVLRFWEHDDPVSIADLVVDVVAKGKSSPR